MIGYFSLSVPSGLSLYWLVSEFNFIWKYIILFSSSFGLSATQIENIVFDDKSFLFFILSSIPSCGLLSMYYDFFLFEFIWSKFCTSEQSYNAVIVLILLNYDLIKGKILLALDVPTSVLSHLGIVWYEIMHLQQGLWHFGAFIVIFSKLLVSAKYQVLFIGKEGKFLHIIQHFRDFPVMCDLLLVFASSYSVWHTFL